MSKKTALNVSFVHIAPFLLYNIWRPYLGCYTPATLITEKNKIMIKKQRWQVYCYLECFSAQEIWFFRQA